MRPRWWVQGLARLTTVGVLGAVLGAGLGAGLTTLDPAPAHAHAALVGTSPVSGAQLDSAPSEVRLRFSERITVAAGGVVLQDATGATVPTEPAVVPPEAPTEVRLALPPDLGDGTWIVSWRVVSADSHPISGVLVFSVGVAGPAPTDPVLAADDPVLPVIFAVFRWSGYAGLALLAGTLCVFVLCWPGGWAARRARRVVTAGWLVSLAGAAGSLLLQGPYAAGRSVAGVADPTLLAVTLDTDYGRYMVARLVLLAVAGGLLLAVPGLPTRVRDTAALGCGLALPATWIGTGHANTAGGPAQMAVDVAHLVAMSTWFGGLALLAICVLPASAGLPATEVGPAVRRFSLLATTAVATLVVTGVLIAWREVGSLDALAGTRYGQLLAVKLAVVGVLLWLGALSRSVVQRRYARAEPPAAAAEPTASRSRRRAAREAERQERDARAQLHRSVRLEVVTGAGVLAVATVLAVTPPGVVVDAAEASAATAGPFQQQLLLGETGAEVGTVEVLVDPAWSGENRVEVTVWDLAGDPWDVPEVSASLSHDEEDLGPLPVDLARTGPGSYAADAAMVPLPGDWQLRLSVRTSDFERATVVIEIPIA